jgi:hypothetical protein
MLFMQSRREEAENTRPDADEYSAANIPSQLEKDLGAFQGAKSAQKIIVIEYEDENSKPEFKAYPIQNNDKLFETTERSVEARIIKGFSVPKELINAEKSSGLSNGSEKKQAILEFNDNTAADRLDLSETLAEIFNRFYRNINPGNNWNIVPVTAIAADDSPGIKAGNAINGLLQSAIPQKNKIAALIYAYGFKQAEAEAMCA